MVQKNEFALTLRTVFGKILWTEAGKVRFITQVRMFLVTQILKFPFFIYFLSNIFLHALPLTFLLITENGAEVGTYIVKSSQDPVCLSLGPTVYVLWHVHYAPFGA